MYFVSLFFYGTNVSINLNDVDTDIKPSSQQSGIPKQALKVGDNVGFKNKEGLDLYGKVIRLNPKAATIEIAPKHQWRVHYSHLFPVLDGEQGTDKYLRKIKLTLNNMDYQLNKEYDLNKIRKFTF